MAWYLKHISLLDPCSFVQPTALRALHRPGEKCLPARSEPRDLAIPSVPLPQRIIRLDTTRRVWRSCSSRAPQLGQRGLNRLRALKRSTTMSTRTVTRAISYSLIFGEHTRRRVYWKHRQVTFHTAMWRTVSPTTRRTRGVRRLASGYARSPRLQPAAPESRFDAA